MGSHQRIHIPSVKVGYTRWRDSMNVPGRSGMAYWRQPLRECSELEGVPSRGRRKTEGMSVRMMLSDFGKAACLCLRMISNVPKLYSRTHAQIDHHTQIAGCAQSLFFLLPIPHLRSVSTHRSCLQQLKQPNLLSYPLHAKLNGQMAISCLSAHANSYARPYPHQIHRQPICRIYDYRPSPLREPLPGRWIAKEASDYSSSEDIPVLAPRISASSRLSFDALVPRSFTPTVRSTDLPMLVRLESLRSRSGGQRRSAMNARSLDNPDALSVAMLSSTLRGICFRLDTVCSQVYPKVFAAFSLDSPASSQLPRGILLLFLVTPHS
ncbi:hypothetical protein NMY22_g16998 [Coprinellus aureogranulatus]|nr:hypothetical protein NMY22_g16998 [Coprinellus aureogranulatus]